VSVEVLGEEQGCSVECLAGLVDRPDVGLSSEFGWRSYLGDLYGTPAVPVYAAPARATDLTGLPPAYICAGNVDGFRDDAIDYATRLNQAGGRTAHLRGGCARGQATHRCPRSARSV
jgi:acetyl esterase/lipase